MLFVGTFFFLGLILIPFSGGCLPAERFRSICSLSVHGKSFLKPIRASQIEYGTKLLKGDQILTWKKHTKYNLKGKSSEKREYPHNLHKKQMKEGSSYYEKEVEN